LSHRSHALSPQSLPAGILNRQSNPLPFVFSSNRGGSAVAGHSRSESKSPKLASHAVPASFSFGTNAIKRPKHTDAQISTGSGPGGSGQSQKVSQSDSADQPRARVPINAALSSAPNAGVLLQHVPMPPHAFPISFVRVDFSKTIEHYKAQLCKSVMHKINCTTLGEKTPWPHEMAVVNKFLQYNGLYFFVVNHKMGTGKTATIAQLYAALCTARMDSGNTKPVSMIISVPTTTMEQWCVAVRNWLDLSDEFDTTGESHDANVLVTNCAKDLQELSENKRIIITTPACLSQIHKLYCAYNEEFSQNEKRKWQGRFAQIAALGPPFGRSFDILVIDEVQPCKNPATATAHLHHVLACHSTHRILLSGTIV